MWSVWQKWPWKWMNVFYLTGLVSAAAAAATSSSSSSSSTNVFYLGGFSNLGFWRTSPQHRIKEYRDDMFPIRVVSAFKTKWKMSVSSYLASAALWGAWTGLTVPWVQWSLCTASTQRHCSMLPILFCFLRRECLQNLCGQQQKSPMADPLLGPNLDPKTKDLCDPILDTILGPYLDPKNRVSIGEFCCCPLC